VRWVEVAEVGTDAVVAPVAVVDVVQAGWAALLLPDRAATVSARAAGTASRTRWACPATRKSARNAAHRWHVNNRALGGWQWRLLSQRTAHISTR
jgi:hypothetical protein